MSFEALHEEIAAEFRTLGVGREFFGDGFSTRRLPKLTDADFKRLTTRLYWRQWRAKNPERARAYQKAYRERFPERAKKSARDRAKRYRATAKGKKTQAAYNKAYYAAHAEDLRARALAAYWARKPAGGVR